jgi:phosphatidylserine synthase
MTPILPWIAHLYTATGAVIALLATGMTFAHNFRAVFIYFIAATFVDSTDGVLARALRVKERLPNFDGAKLDDIIDYLMYAFIPALVVWQADMVPSRFRSARRSCCRAPTASRRPTQRSPPPITSSPASPRTGTSSSSTSTCCS